MYLDYYNIIENPFHLDKDKTYLWLGGNFSKVILTLKEAAMERKGIIFLAGNEGTGKSTIIKMITSMLEDQFKIATLSKPGLTSLDFFNFLSAKFGFNKEFKSKSAFLVHLRNFLRDSQAINKSLLLIIDEADQLKIEFFEELVLLSDIELNDRKMISILLVGRKGWTDESMQKNEKKISNKIAVECNLDPISKEDTAKYINHCLAAGGSEEKIFDERAFQEIFSFSGGNLKLINTICDHALRKGYSKRKKVLNSAFVKECVKELSGEMAINQDLDSLGKLDFEKERKKKKSIASSPTASHRKWFWLKAFCVILFLFSSYLLYRFQTEDSNTWKTDEIAPKEYDFQKFKKEEANFDDNPQGINENHTGSESVQPASQSVSPKIKNEALESSMTKKRISSDESPETKQEWPFATFKKIVYFKYDSNTLPPESLEILDKIAEFAIHNPDKEYIIKGYTDSTGAYSYNLTISKFRADSVKNYLIAKGVNPANLETFGLGSQDPIFSNRTAGGRKLNRRVEIELNLD